MSGVLLTYFLTGCERACEDDRNTYALCKETINNITFGHLLPAPADGEIGDQS